MFPGPSEVGDSGSSAFLWLSLPLPFCTQAPSVGLHIANRKLLLSPSPSFFFDLRYTALSLFFFPIYRESTSLLMVAAHLRIFSPLQHILSPLPFLADSSAFPPLTIPDLPPGTNYLPTQAGINVLSSLARSVFIYPSFFFLAALLRVSRTAVCTKFLLFFFSPIWSLSLS